MFLKELTSHSMQWSIHMTLAKSSSVQSNRFCCMTHVPRDICKRAVDAWQEYELNDCFLKEFEGGLTNKRNLLEASSSSEVFLIVFRCSVKKDEVRKKECEEHVLVRIYGNNTEYIIDRVRELSVSFFLLLKLQLKESTRQ